MATSFLFRTTTNLLRLLYLMRSDSKCKSSELLEATKVSVVPAVRLELTT